MEVLNRRQFLRASGVAGAAALASGTGLVSWRELRARAATDPLPSGAKVLVLLTLYGGNDGLGTVIPYTDPALRAARPELAYDAGTVLPLDGALGLAPAMPGLHALWQQHRLAVVRGVGYPQPDHSHFRSMDIWQTASPATPVTSGWIGRWLDATGDDPLRAVNIGAVLPPLAVGEHSTAAALALGTAQPLAPDLAAAVAGLGTPDHDDTTSAAEVRAAYRAERQVARTFGGLLAQPTAGGGTGSLTAQLDMVARCVEAGVPTSVYCVSLSGFDTHADEKGTQSALLGQLDTAVSGFLRTMADDPHGRGVVLAAYSEFGRRVVANASQGTDHGTANPVLVAGVPVRGGFYGDQPSLTDLDDGDLRSTTDFRSVYAELTHSVLGADPDRIIRARLPQLGFLT